MATCAASPVEAEQSRSWLRHRTAILWIAIAVAVLLQVELAVSKSINWDEFFHFSQIHQHLRGDPVQWLQTPHVRLFSWVPGLPGDPLTHIRLIRLMLLAFELVVVAVIFDGVRRQSSAECGQLAALLWLTGGFVFTQGFALRADIVATALLMAALWVLLIRPWRIGEFALVGALAALACVATIKSVLWLPAFAGVALLRRDAWPAKKVVALVIPVAVAIALGGAIASVAAPDAADDVLSLARASADRMFTAGLFPQGPYLLKQILIAPVLSIALAVSAGQHWRSDKRDARAYGSLLLMAPLLTLAIYRNAYPYHIAFVLAPAALAMAPGAEWLRARFGAGPAAVVLLAFALALSFTQDRSVTTRQEAFQQGLSQIFPEPVRYFDDVGVVPNFPRAVPRFASGWALAGYRERGRPDYQLAVSDAPVPLLVRQGYALETLSPAPGDDLALLPDDARFLRENYVRHWGNVYVAGKHLPKADSPATFVMANPGDYTVEGAVLTIDGRRHEVGDVVRLSRGEHHVSPRTRAATLRWGRHLRVPDIQWPDGPVFTDY